MRCSSGTPKAKVLPIPVRACPIRSSPVRASGSVSSWMANGCSMPFSLSARTISSRTPRSAKVASTAAWLGVMSGVMRETRMPFGFVFDWSIVAVTRAPVDFRIRFRFAGPALLRRGQLRARTLHRQRWYGSTTVTWINCSWWAAAARFAALPPAAGRRAGPVGDRQGGVAARSGSPRRALEWLP